MAAPKSPNTEAARVARAANVQRRKLEAAADMLRAAGWTVISPEERCLTCGGELIWSDPQMATCARCGDEWSPDHFGRPIRT